MGFTVEHTFLPASTQKLETVVATEPVIDRSDKFQQFFTTIFLRMPIATQKAIKSDWNSYNRFVISKSALGMTALPDCEEEMMGNMLSYVEYLSERFTVKTIRRRLHHLKVLLSYFGCPNPLMTNHQLKKSISLTIKGIAKPSGQAEPLTVEILNEYLRNSSDDCLMSLRNNVILNLAYDTLCRASELRVLKLKHISRDIDGTGTAFVERTKSDREAIGAYRYISKTTMALIDRWISKTQLTGDDYLIRALTSAGTLKPYLARAIPPVSYEVIVAAFRKADASLSGHSARVGAVIDMVKNGVSLEKIQLSGGWRDPTMPLFYSRKLRAKNSASAEIAAKFGR